MSNQENGTIEVVLCDRDRSGRVVPNQKTPYKTFGGVGKGGGEWLARALARHVTKGVKKLQKADAEDKFFGEGDYAPQPE